MTQLDPRLREHTVWCRDQHNQFHECVREIPVSDRRDAAVVRLVGIPADNQYIEMDPALHSIADIDAAIAALAALRPDFADQVGVEALLTQEPS